MASTPEKGGLLRTLIININYDNTLNSGDVLPDYIVVHNDSNIDFEYGSGAISFNVFRRGIADTWGLDGTFITVDGRITSIEIVSLLGVHELGFNYTLDGNSFSAIQTQLDVSRDQITPVDMDGALLITIHFKLPSTA